MSIRNRAGNNPTMAVKVAKDVIAQLNSGAIQGQCGIYVGDEVQTALEDTVDTFSEKALDKLQKMAEEEFGAGVNIDADYFNLESVEVDLRKVVREAVKPHSGCQVCGIGSIFVSKVRMADNTKVTVMTSEIDETLCPGSDIFDSQLFQVFSPAQLDMIESAFEMHECTNYGTDYADPKIVRSVLFGQRYNDDSDRLQAIMENIIENKGTFKP